MSWHRKVDCILYLLFNFKCSVQQMMIKGVIVIVIESVGLCWISARSEDVK